MANEIRRRKGKTSLANRLRTLFEGIGDGVVACGFGVALAPYPRCAQAAPPQLRKSIKLFLYRSDSLLSAPALAIRSVLRRNFRFSVTTWRRTDCYLAERVCHLLASVVSRLARHSDARLGL